MIRTTLLAAAAALVTSSAFAQTSPNPPAPPIPQSQMTNPLPASASKTAPTAEAATDLRVSNLIGVNVRNNADATIGEIEDIVLDEKMMTKGYIVSVGGFLGLGERHVAVAPADIRFARKDGAGPVTAMMNATKDSLKAMPQYKYMSTWRNESAASRAPMGAAPPAGTAAPASAPGMTGALTTEAGARAALSSAGYTGVEALTRAADGGWTAKAMKDSKSVTVMIDAKGAVTTR